jgi:hypothetical protein
MSYRILIIAMAAVLIWAGVAYITGFGAAAFLYPGEIIAEVVFPHTTGTFIVHDAANPAQAMTEAAVSIGSQSFARALWCAIGFWLVVPVVVGALAHRLPSAAPDVSRERTHEG